MGAEIMSTRFFAFLMAVAVTAQAYAVPIEVVQNGTSDYVIFHELTAPQSLTTSYVVVAGGKFAKFK